MTNDTLNGVRRTHVVTVCVFDLIVYGRYVWMYATWEGIDWFSFIVEAFLGLFFILLSFVMSILCIDSIIKYLRIKKNLLADLFVGIITAILGIIVVDLALSGNLMRLFDPRMD